VGDQLCELISAPATFGSAAAAIEALWRGWPKLPRLPEILRVASGSDSPLMTITAIRGRIALGKHGEADFSTLSQLGERDDYDVDGLIREAMVAGWAGDERLRTYALEPTPGEANRVLRHLRPDFSLLVSGFPGDSEVAALIANDLRDEYPQCMFDKSNLVALAAHFKNDPTVVAAIESWVAKQESDSAKSGDAYTLSHLARIAPTPLLKSALVRCVEFNHLAFWAASALVDLWGSEDEQVVSVLTRCSEFEVAKRQNIAHVLPLDLADKPRCRELLLEIVEADGRIRADFALEGLRSLGVDASDRDAIDRVLTRNYDEERFVVENEAREVILTFHGDERVVALAIRQLRREFGAIGAVARAYSDNAEMRRLALDAMAPLDLGMRLAMIDSLSVRAVHDTDALSLIASARHEDAGEIMVAASIRLAKANKESASVTEDYLIETQKELDAIGPRMDARRQGAMAALSAVKRFDLIKPTVRTAGSRGIGLRSHREMLRFVASEWFSIVEGFGGEAAALAAIGVNRDDFCEVFGNDFDASTDVKAFALRLIDEGASKGASEAAIRFVERARPRSGFLRELCLRSLRYDNRTNWESHVTALTAGEVLGRQFATDQDLEKRLTTIVQNDPRDIGALIALCEGWPKSASLESIYARLSDDARVPIAVAFRLMSIFSPSEHLQKSLQWAVDYLQGGLWDCVPYWMPSVVRRLRDDDTAYKQIRRILSSQPSPGAKASFPRILSRARGFSADLRAWCREECQRAEGVLVPEVGLDLIAGQKRLVIQSLFDLMSARDI
jgi:hypothetical protein